MTRLCLALLAGAPTMAHAETGELADLVAEALDANPSIAALEHRAEALRARADVAGSWPDPMVAVELSNLPVTSWSLSQHPMSGVQLRVEQTLRPPAWSRHRRGVARLEADAQDHAVAEAGLELALAVRRAWWDLARTRMLREQTEVHVRRTEELRAAVQSRYETGAVGQHAVLRLRVLRDRLSDELGDFDQRVGEIEAALLRALAAEEGRTFATPGTVAALPVVPLSDWSTLAAEHRPLLAGLRSEQQAAEEAARLARLDALPDPSVWAGYRVRTIATDTDPGTDFVSVGVGVPLPAGSARRAGGDRAAALERSAAARAAYEAAQDRISADMQRIVVRWERAWDKTRSYDDGLIPSAVAALRTTQADFTVGRADFASLYDAEVVLLDLERARIAAAVETHLQLAEATAVLGAAPPPGDPP